MSNNEFRSTAGTATSSLSATRGESPDTAEATPAPAQDQGDARQVRVGDAGRTATRAESLGTRGYRDSGRVRHTEKITVYLSDEELMALEHARLELRSSHGLGVDRGRVVRAAIALALSDLHDNGADSALVARLAGQ